jgi:fluoride exporter
MIKILFIIGSGSFLGGVTRFLTSKYIQDNISTSFPLGTFLVNLIGCFLIGIFYGLSERGNGMNMEYRLFLTVGFCGGFTTFSTFSNENLAMLRDGNMLQAAFYISGSVFFGILATYLGSTIIKSF